MPHGPILDHVVIFLAAVAAGMINSIAGGGTLVSFPTLVWLGRDPIMANVTNTVALWPGSLGAMVAFRRDLAESRDWLALLAVPSLAGGLIGAVLLLLTPTRVFASLVPYLILFATLLLAAQEPIARVLGLEAVEGRGRRGRHRAGAAVFQFFVALYGGYFGAGMGILMLAALGLLGFTDIHRMNALKNLLAVCINLIAAAYFVAFGPVNWPDALVMTVGTIAGGYGGAGLALRAGRRRVRRAVVLIGLLIALSFFVRG